MVSPDPTLSRDIAIVTGIIVAAICSALSPWTSMIGSSSGATLGDSGDSGDSVNSGAA